MFKIKTLQQRFVVYMLLPVALLLWGMGATGFIYARSVLIRQWEEAAILRLQRAAHQVDMRLMRPKNWVDLSLSFLKGHRHPGHMLQQLLDGLERPEGVIAVRVTSIDGGGEGSGNPHHFGNGPAGAGGMRGAPAMGHQMMGGRRFHIGSPTFDPDTTSRTVSMITRAESGRGDGDFQVEVVMDFDFLMSSIGDTGWWQSRKSFLVDSEGTILAGTTPQTRRQLNGDDPLEAATLRAIQNQTSGTLRGAGHPPQEISGFYRLTEAPWYMVTFAPGDEILAPIIRFRTIYFVILTLFVLIILVLIRRVTVRVARAVNQLSEAAGDIAKGKFDLALPERTGDEIGALTRSFNTMAAQLKERLYLRQSLDLAKEVQQTLLPVKAPDYPGLDVAGRSIFCEETGGDYYDFLPGKRFLQLIIGDVAGHGIASALLMSSVRASLRQRSDERDDLGAVISDVNRQIAMDVGDSGRFLTLLALRVDAAGKNLHWVRAGHDPGILYRRAEERFEALGSADMALGIDPDWSYRTMTTDGLQEGDIILLGTDGIWEAYSEERGMFGKEAVKQILTEQRDRPAEAILESIFDAVQAHACEIKAADDKTLIVVKIISKENDRNGKDRLE